jgi:hypothetical protein
MAHPNLLHLKARPVSCERPSTAIISPETALRRTVLAELLSKSQCCEQSATVVDCIASLVPQVDAAAVAALAVEARERTQLCSVPLLLVREMARHASHRALVGATLARVIQHANEISDFVAIYWSDGRQPLSAQVKKGLAAAFAKFDGHELAECDRSGSVALRDVLFLCHPRPRNITQEVLWKELADAHSDQALI